MMHPPVKTAVLEEPLVQAVPLLKAVVQVQVESLRRRIQLPRRRVLPRRSHTVLLPVSHVQLTLKPSRLYRPLSTQLPNRLCWSWK
jgi:hypothetical protein